MRECSECGDGMLVQDTHRSYSSFTDFTVIKYWECEGCGNTEAEEIEHG